MQLFAVMLVVCLAATLIASPLLWRRESLAGDDDLAALEAAKDAKFREIRDAEHDMRTGKLSPDDFRELDSALRAEAVDILRGMDSARTERTEP
jgi:hypothetical protein